MQYTCGVRLFDAQNTRKELPTQNCRAAVRVRCIRCKVAGGALHFAQVTTRYTGYRHFGSFLKKDINRVQIRMFRVSLETREFK
jgi:hypothetical protein